MKLHTARNIKKSVTNKSNVRYNKLFKKNVNVRSQCQIFIRQNNTNKNLEFVKEEHDSQVSSDHTAQLTFHMVRNF